jgi:hypothetical protein
MLPYVPLRGRSIRVTRSQKTNLGTKLEYAMKLNSELVERTLGQIEADAIPENHPVFPKLKGLFGDHTFFLDSSGLNIVEPMMQMPRMGKLVNVASWDDADPSQLLAHLPEPTIF